VVRYAQTWVAKKTPAFSRTDCSGIFHSGLRYRGITIHSCTTVCVRPGCPPSESCEISGLTAETALLGRNASGCGKTPAMGTSPIARQAQELSNFYAIHACNSQPKKGSSNGLPCFASFFCAKDGVPNPMGEPIHNHRHLRNLTIAQWAYSELALLGSSPHAAQARPPAPSLSGIPPRVNQAVNSLNVSSMFQIVSSSMLTIANVSTGSSAVVSKSRRAKEFFSL